MNAPPILARSRPRVSVLDRPRGEVLDFLRTRLAAHRVAAAYLTGSYAAGTAGPWSDLDVVVVHDSRLPPTERPREFLDLLDLGVPVDILVYTPAEFAGCRRAPRGFWREFEDNHLRLL